MPTNMRAHDQKKLFIERQHSLTTVKVFKEGMEKSVHVVVKNQPFSVHLATKGINLKRVSFDVKLLYDIEELKEVSFIKEKPVHAGFHLSDSGDQLTAEVKIKVLTSQLEDSFFRLEFFAVDSKNNHKIESIKSVLSEPIRVVSKPEQVKKKRTPKLASVTNSGTKRSHNEKVFVSLDRIESQCTQQEQLLAEIFSKWQKVNNMIQSTMSELLVDKKFHVHPFEGAFFKFIQMCQSLHQQEISMKVRKISKNLHEEKRSPLFEMLELFASELPHDLARETNEMPFQSESCLCEDCPHRNEIERMNELSCEFLGV